MPKLEDFLAGKPLNEEMQKLMRGEEAAEETAEETAAEPSQSHQNYADGTPITNHDREHLRRTVASAGWRVLLKLLDTALQHQEDAARRLSLARSTPKGELVLAWEVVAANREARDAIVHLAELEIEKLKQCATGTTKTATATN